MKARRPCAGLTLIEVLIAVTLLSLLAVGMLFALRVGLGAMDSSQRRLLANRRAANAQRVLQAQVGGFLPALAHCGATAQNWDTPLLPFFTGQPTVMRFVTAYSLTGVWRGEAQIAELFVVAGENGLGVRLVENEIPYRGPVGAGLFCRPPGAEMGGIAASPLPEARADSFVVADKLATCRFLYLMDGPNPETPDLWVPLWQRIDGWPRAIRIEMVPLEQQALRLPPMTFTGRIRVTHKLGEKYEF